MRLRMRTLFFAVSLCFVSCVAYAQFDVGSLVTLSRPFGSQLLSRVLTQGL
jgi:hypothetical protein